MVILSLTCFRNKTEQKAQYSLSIGISAIPAMAKTMSQFSIQNVIHIIYSIGKHET